MSIVEFCELIHKKMTDPRKALSIPNAVQVLHVTGADGETEQVSKRSI